MPLSPAPCPPQLELRTLDRGDGLLGLRPCGPVKPPSRSPLFGARGPLVTVARLAWAQPGNHTAQATAQTRLRQAGLHPLPAQALQWRGGVSPLDDRPLWSLVREADFADFWADELPRLRAEGWTISLLPGFAHAAEPVSGWQIELQPLAQKTVTGMGSWLLSLGITIQTRQGPEVLDLVPLLARLIARDRRWTDAQALAKIDGEEMVRLQAPGGRRIDAPAAPLKAIVGAMLDLLLRPRHRTGTPLTLSSWDSQRLALLRVGLSDAMASHPSARRDWLLQADGLPAALANAASAPPPVAEPAGLGIQLRPYQLHGLAWLQQLREQRLAGILADDMGLGKTAQALAHVLLEKQAGRLDLPALVVAPASLIFNWQAEARLVAPDLRLLTLQGPRRSADFARIQGHDLVLTSYPLLWRDAQALQRQRWHLVVLDEAQMVKDAGSRTATAARRLNARHRLSLTGTPMENHLGELWAQFHFLLPGFLGDSRSFARDWRTPIEKNGETQRALLLAQRLAPFILRRRKEQVATELPPLTEQIHRVELLGPQRSLYESLRLAADERVRRILARQKFDGALVSILDALLKLRQVCNDPRLLPPDAAPLATAATGPSAKINWLREMLPALVAEGRRVLVFSQFTRMLGLIGDELDALGQPWLSLTGDTAPARRADIVARFQRAELPLLLVSLKAGGVGLNLTAADTVVQVDPWWNPAVERQASARAHRIGQQQPVTVYRLLAAGSIEEKLLALQARKASLASLMLGDAAATAESAAMASGQMPFEASDLQDLLAPL